ncbi:hypothetical protein L1887_45987 [Cichorium endivia]|nr:hypothetical protein L1887_45987 [Cichorium endivia]
MIIASGSMPLRRFRLLALHGKGTSARIMKTQIKPIVDALGELFEVEYLEGGERCAPYQGIESIFPGQAYFSWYEQPTRAALQAAHSRVAAKLDASRGCYGKQGDDSQQLSAAIALGKEVGIDPLAMHPALTDTASTGASPALTPSYGGTDSDASTAGPTTPLEERRCAFDGVICFSQGCAVSTGMLLELRARVGAGLDELSVRLVILICGGRPFESGGRAAARGHEGCCAARNQERACAWPTRHESSGVATAGIAVRRPGQAGDRTRHWTLPTAANLGGGSGGGGHPQRTCDSGLKKDDNRRPAACVERCFHQGPARAREAQVEVRGARCGPRGGRAGGQASAESAYSPRNSKLDSWGNLTRGEVCIWSCIPSCIWRVRQRGTATPRYAAERAAAADWKASEASCAGQPAAPHSIRAARAAQAAHGDFKRAEQCGIAPKQTASDNGRRAWNSRRDELHEKELPAEDAPPRSVRVKPSAERGGGCEFEDDFRLRPSQVGSAAQRSASQCSSSTQQLNVQLSLDQHPPPPLVVLSASSHFQRTNLSLSPLSYRLGRHPPRHPRLHLYARLTPTPTLESLGLLFSTASASSRLVSYRLLSPCCRAAFRSVQQRRPSPHRIITASTRPHHRDPSVPDHFVPLAAAAASTPLAPSCSEIRILLCITAPASSWENARFHLLAASPACTRSQVHCYKACI